MKKEKIIEILILIVVIVGLISSFCIFRYYKYEKPNTYSIIFKDIDSIVKGSPVRFMGINVGHVVSLKRKDKYIVIKIRVTKKDVNIPDYTRAKVAFNGLGGSKSIELLPPLTDDSEVKGIISSESLRLNDLSGIFRELKDVALVINNFVLEIDEKALSDSFRDLSNPEIINRVDADMEKILERQKGSKANAKDTVKKENSFIDIIDWFNKSIEEFTNTIKK